MEATLFTNVLVPIASEDDARSTMRVLLPYLESAGGSATLVHVVEKAGGALDKASVEQRERDTVAMFDAARDVVGDAPVEVDTEIRYGTDVAETIIEAGHDLSASAIVFTPRGGNRWFRLLAGDVALSLLTDSDLPVVALPDENGDENKDEDQDET